MIKKALVAALGARLEAELASLRQAAEAAREAATHEESKPENKYDTRGLEASYLAGAQAERAAELEQALKQLSGVPLKSFEGGARIGLSALVEVDREGEALHYFLMPVGGGHKLAHEGLHVTIIKPQSPLGRQLVGKTEGESFRLASAQGEKELEILQVR
jgi:transcription elongation GreA/GreB family factor